MGTKKEPANDGVMRAYIYGRYSSHAQKDTSIEQQFAEIHAYCKANGIRVVGEYADRAISGKTDARPEFQRLMRDAQKGRVQLVVCWKVDRFARNRYDSAMYKARLKRYGVRVLYAKESIPDGPEGILLESVLEGSAEYYSANLAQNIRRGMRANALECKVNQGNLPLGYVKGADGRFAIEPHGAEIVREVYEMYVNDNMCPADICVVLNSRGVRTSRGAKFNKNSLRTMLQNERYIGVYEYADVRIEGGVPVIIPRELWDLAQEKRKKSARAPASSWSDVDYLLTGQIFCGDCGGAMIGESGTSKTGTKYNYYACSTRKRKKTCNKKAVKKDEIEELVVRYTRDYILTDKVIEQISDAIVDLMRRERENSDVKIYERQIADINKRINNIISAIEQGIITPTTKERLSELEEQRAQLQDDLDRVSVEKPIFTREQMIYWFRQFRNGDASDPKFKTKIIETFINAVYVFDDKLKIVYNYTSDLTEPVNLSFVDGLCNAPAEGFGFGALGSTRGELYEHYCNGKRRIFAVCSYWLR